MERRAQSPTNSSGVVASTTDAGGILSDARKNKTIDINEPAHKFARKERKLTLGLKRMTYDLVKLEKSPETAHKHACEEMKLILGPKIMTHDLAKLEKSPLLQNGKIYNQHGEEVSPHKLARLKRKYLLQSKQRMSSHFSDKATPIAELSPHRHAHSRTMDVLRSKQKKPHHFIEEGASVVCESPHEEASRKLEATLIVGEPQQARRIRKEILNAKHCGRQERGQQCQGKCATQIPQCRLRIRAERRRQRRREKNGQMTEEQLIMLRARSRQNKRNQRARLTEEQLAAVRERCRRRYIECTSRLRRSCTQRQRNHETQKTDVQVRELLDVPEYEQIIHQKRSLFQRSVSNIQGATEKLTNSLDTGKCSPEPIECLVEVPILEVDQPRPPHCMKRSTDMNDLQLPMGHLREVPIIEVRNVHELQDMLHKLEKMTHDLVKLEKSPETAHKHACEERKLILGPKITTHDLAKLEKSPLLHNGKIFNQLGEEVSPHKLARLKRKYLLQSKQRMSSHFIDKATPMAELSPHRRAYLRTMDVLRSNQEKPHPFTEEGTSVICESPHEEASRKLEATLIVGEPQQARRIRKEILNAKRCGRQESEQQCQGKCATQIHQCRLRIRAERWRQRLREKKGQTEEQLIMLRALNRQSKRNHRTRLNEEQLAAVREHRRRRYIESTSRLRQSCMQRQRNREAQKTDVHVREVFDVPEYEQMFHQKRSLYRRSVSNIQGATEKPTNSLDSGNCFPEPIECFVEVPLLEVDQSHTPHCTKRSIDMNNLQLPMEHLREVPIIEVRNIHELEDMLHHSGYNSTLSSCGTPQ